MNSQCPCKSPKLAPNCCNPIIDGNRNAKTAEELMRSRYTAYSYANINYLLKSHHSSTRPIKEKRQIEQWAKSVQWIGLQIIETDKGQATDINGTVEFKASYIENGHIQQIHEKSLFKKENNEWFYVSGIHY